MSLHVKNFDAKWTSQELQKSMECYEGLISARIYKGKADHLYGEVVFVSAEAAEKAMALINKSPNKMYAAKYKIPIHNIISKDSNVYVNNLPLHVGSEELKIACTPYGKVINAIVFEAKLKKNKVANFKYGFVCFIDSQSATSFIHDIMENKKTLWDINIYANLEESNEQKMERKKEIKMKKDKEKEIKKRRKLLKPQPIILSPQMRIYPLNLHAIFTLVPVLQTPRIPDMYLINIHQIANTQKPKAKSTDLRSDICSSICDMGVCSDVAYILADKMIEADGGSKKLLNKLMLIS